MANYYQLQAEEFQSLSPVNFEFVSDYPSLCRSVARDLVDLIKERAAQGQMAKVILPVGPIDFTYVADLINKENVSCESLIVFAMDEYLDQGGCPIPTSHPLSFRSFFKHQLNDRLDLNKRIPENQIILPCPENLDSLAETIQSLGGIDITFGGFGINGHFAFNSPIDGLFDVEVFRNLSVRTVTLRESDITQFAINGTHGNLEIIPTTASTLGPKELLGAKKLHLTFMRSWHAGVLRRALFGPISAAFPGSLVQLHKNVVATITPEAAAVPVHDLLMGVKAEVSPK